MSHLFLPTIGAGLNSTYPCATGFGVTLVVMSVLVCLMLDLAGCSGGETLTGKEQQKLDAELQRLIKGKTRDRDFFSTSKREDGTTVYSVLIRCDDPDVLRKVGLNISSVMGEIVTARLSVAEIRRAAQIEEVNHIENASRVSPDQ